MGIVCPRGAARDAPGSAGTISTPPDGSKRLSGIAYIREIAPGSGTRGTPLETGTKCRCRKGARDNARAFFTRANG
ncbi:hypothetical protein GCM10007301_56360 [Azorhizobium oxalatiphilum]|uniref:Uncharacterized protein n=1 Tax=Azorhizobium oxalatiphilum TaxID=980631 RepID=A0A917CHG8_9HYPH|nr:hypothetical protein GCM10007301_56360 [Azorhizobium oxalatiphilum]